MLSKVFSRVLFALMLLLGFQFASAAQHCVILQYHHFSDATPRSTSVTPQQFAAHLQYLDENDFKVMALRDVVLALYHQLDLPDRCVSLTVDDAFQSVYDNAYPMLKPYGWGMTIFVSADPVDRGLNPYMDWDQLRELAANGFAIENQGHSHIHLLRKRKAESDRDWLNRIAADIDQGSARIHAETGTQPTLFAYPYGEYNPAIQQLMTARKLIGFGQQSGPAWPDANFAALPRFPMAAQYADLPGFNTKVNTLPLPVVRADPVDPLVDPSDRRPALELTLAPGRYSRTNLRCYVSGRDNVDMQWVTGQPDTVRIAPRFDLSPGRHRTNCTMPSDQRGRFHWYSHNWIVRKPDGGWYAEQ